MKKIKPNVEIRDFEKIWKQYENGISFQQNMGFNIDFPTYERFKMGNQWPDVTERTKALPRPVFNIVQMFVQSKKSNVLNENIKIMYSSAETGDNLSEMYGDKMDIGQETQEKASEGSDKYTEFAENLWNELDQESLNDLCVEDAATNGTGILHYYWDNAVGGGEIAPYTGALRGECIDALNFFVSNPQEQDIQKQEWIILSSRISVHSLKRMAKMYGCSHEEIDLIRPDDDVSNENYDVAKKELNDSKKVTLLTKYYRKDNGLVYYSKSTKNVIIAKDVCLTPIYDENTGDTSENADNNVETDDSEQQISHGITLYPIAIFDWQNRKKCIFGRGEVEGIIPNQKAINFNIAMLLLSVQDTAWPKLITKPNALKQSVTNLPGEILTDWNTSGDGIKYLQPPQFGYGVINLVDKVLELSRLTSGVTETATGEALGANMAASAIIALQNQAKVPIDNIQRRFYKTIKDVGRIWEQFFKTYYNQPRMITKVDENGRQTVNMFLGVQYSDVEFKLKIDVGACSAYSESLGQATLDKIYDKGDIDLDTYVKLAPANVMPFKETLTKILDERKRTANEQAQQMQQMQVTQQQQASNPAPSSAQGSVFDLAVK